MSDIFGSSPPTPPINPYASSQRDRQRTIFDQIKTRLGSEGQKGPPAIPEVEYVPPMFMSDKPISSYKPSVPKYEPEFDVRRDPMKESRQFSPDPIENFRGFDMKNAPQVSVPQGPIQNMIMKKAEMYGVNPRLALGIAHAESSFNPQARNDKSSAGGLYQFTNDTWKQYGRGDRFDPMANADAGMKLLKNNQSFLSKHGIQPSDEATYLAHFLGATGAVKVLSKPNDLVSKHISEDAVEANNLHGMTGKDLINWAGRKLDYSKKPPMQLAGD